MSQMCSVSAHVEVFFVFFLGEIWDAHQVDKSITTFICQEHIGEQQSKINISIKNTKQSDHS